MSARERKRYLTTAIVFLLAFSLLGALIFPSVKSFALTFTFRPTGGASGFYALNGTLTTSTRSLNLAFDPNLSTASVTYTNADFAGDGFGTPDLQFYQSAIWSAFDQTVYYLKSAEIFVLRRGELNSNNQWEILFSYDGGANWHTLDSSEGVYGPNPCWPETDPCWPAGDHVSALIPVPLEPDHFSDLRDVQVQVNTRQENALTAKLIIFDIRIDAEWDDLHAGPEPLHITTEAELPTANRFTPYDETVQATGGIPGYTWEITKGFLPPAFDHAVVNDQFNITYTTPPSTTPGTYGFTLEVTDHSQGRFPQTDAKNFTLVVEGLAIVPHGPTLTPAKKNTLYLPSTNGQRFDPNGGTGPPYDYYWCRTGIIPRGMSLLLWNGADSTDLPVCPAWWKPPPDVPPDDYSVYQGDYVQLTGVPLDDGIYRFGLKLVESGESSMADEEYTLEVGATGVTVIPKKLQDYVKGITYGTGATDVSPDVITISNVSNIGAAGDIYVLPYPPASASLPITNLVLSPGGAGSLPETTEGFFEVKIITTGIPSEIPLTEPSGTRNFEIGVRDLSNPLGETDSEIYSITVLDRRTLLLQNPSSTASLPTNHQLNFLVFAEGGAPSTPTDSSLDGKSVPFYNYAWLVQPADEQTPELDTAYGFVNGGMPNPPYEKTAVLIPIRFEHHGAPTSGTYDVTFWAQDNLSRDNPPDSAPADPPDHPVGIDANDAYEFTPATVRIKVIAAGGRTLERETGGKTMLKQEQFR